MLKHWILAARPKTLWAAVAPVMIGTAMAYGDGVAHLASALTALIGALLIQIGTNFCNDYADFKKGADTTERVGPVRATQAGLISPKAMLMATIIIFVLAAMASFYLICRAGWPVVAIGVVSILSGILYTAGPVPLAYVGLGDLFVLVFFGPVAVAGTYFVQALHVPWYVVVAGCAPGFWSTAILTVNNLRDVETDRKAFKKTLAVRFGKTFARLEYAACALLAFGIPLFIAYRMNKPGIGWTGILLFVAIPLMKNVWTKDGAALNPFLGFTALLLLAHSLLFSITWVLCD